MPSFHTEYTLYALYHHRVLPLTSGLELPKVLICLTLYRDHIQRGAVGENGAVTPRQSKTS